MLDGSEREEREERDSREKIEEEERRRVCVQKKFNKEQ